MTWYPSAEAAQRAGVSVDYLAHLLELGVLACEVPDRCSSGDLRRVLLVKSLEDAGLPLDGIGAAIRRGALSLDFMDRPEYERFAPLALETFGQVAARTGVPIELLMIMREALGLAQPSPDDRLREDELAMVPFLEVQVQHGFRPIAIERLMRVAGDSTRRLAEQEGVWWYSEVIEPAIAAGQGSDEIANSALAALTVPLAEQALLAMYHAQQVRAWSANIFDSVEQLLARAGLHSRLERPPAICFLDITGYTRLTQERGDDAAAEMATLLARLVERSSVLHGGKPIKWLGDGVMFYFRDPGPAVRSALEMVDGLAAAGLPPAHVGLHTGPVIFQAGDYFGQTVNLSARIADYARPGEVLVSQAVADAAEVPGIAFTQIGPVELKGVAGTTNLFRAHAA